MARKLILREEIALGQSLSANFTSLPTMIPYMDNCSYQINITTSNSTGTFAVQASDDYMAPSGQVLGNAGNWVTVPLGGATAAPVAAGANDTILIDLNQLPFNAVRVSYTSTVAGTGTVDIWLLNKSMGA